MIPKLKILPKDQLAIYPQLIQIKELGFVLFRGTAIALQLGHRESVDFDFFTHKDLEVKKLLSLQGIKAHRILQQEKDTLIFLTDSKVKLSFFGNIEFSQTANKISTNDQVLEIASLDALLATKLKATCDRAEYKDYFDIITILKQNTVDLSTGLKRFSEFFGNDFPQIQILKGLTYFEDGDLHRLHDSDKRFLLKEVATISQSLTHTH